MSLNWLEIDDDPGDEDSHSDDPPGDIDDDPSG
jgi:hypothetical protein